MDGFEDLWRRVTAAAGGGSGPNGLAEALRVAFEGDRDRSSLERVAIGVAGLSAVAAAGGLAVASILGLALAAVVLYVVLTKVLGLDIRLDPASLFGGAWRPAGSEKG